MNAIKLPMKECLRELTLTVEVSGIKTAKFRLWLGGLMLKLAARVIGCGIEIKTEK